MRNYVTLLGEHVADFIPYDPQRPYFGREFMSTYVARDPETSRRFGRTVMAMVLSNTQYAQRYNRFSRSREMKPPPRFGDKHLGYLVVRRLGTPNEYETWIQQNDFEETYRPSGEEA